ncbi:MAG TPA: nucleotidyltransferase domain-containing protein [Syntrophales bacterium]|nr:nucleotidyltransferase domain-containing protein [Syntrophales bacterium]
MSSGIEIPQQVVAQFCKKWKIVEFSLFGSVLRDDFRPESDVDVMVVFEADTPRGLEDLQEMRAELEGLFGRKVDLVEKRLIEQSENYIRRRHILNNLENLYVAG